jgi:DNA-binding CsgD family transcriptional regulator
LIETAYRIDLPTDQWLQQVAANASAALGSTQGAMAFTYDASSGDWVNIGALGLHGLPAEFPMGFFDQRDMSPENVVALVKIFKTISVGNLRGFIDDGRVNKMGMVLDRHGMDDMVGVNGLDPSARGCMVLVANRGGQASPRTVHTWRRLAAHISAGNRLRTLLESSVQGQTYSHPPAEAVLTPSGKIEHAQGPAEARSARQALHDALVRIQAARSERDDACRAVALWRGLVAGRWSLVEHFERDGRRYYLAHKNDPELTLDRALTLREKQVLAYAEIGYSNKLIAYHLGLSSSTVSTLLAKARKKVGMSVESEK